jgi:TRAP-type C4-dicarboxylate transport system permease small subunit
MDQLTGPLARSNVVIVWISRVMAIIGAAALFVMMITGVIDVVGRYVFLRPLLGAQEIVSATLVIAATMGLGYAQLAKGHIRVTIVNDKVSPKARVVLEIVTCILCAGGAGIVAWRGVLRLVEDYLFNPRGVTELLAFPYWPFMLIFVIGFAWFCIVLLIELFDSVREASKR